MNWEEVGAIGQLLGSVAVFITLGYLALQVRHARMETRRSASSVRVSMTSQQMMAFAVDERLARVFTQAVIGFGSPLPPFMSELVRVTGVTTEEAASLLFAFNAQFQSFAHSIEFIGELSSEERREFEGNLQGMFTAPLFRSYFNNQRPMLNQHAVRYIEKLLTQPGSTPA